MSQPVAATKSPTPGAAAASSAPSTVPSSEPAAKPPPSAAAAAAVSPRPKPKTPTNDELLQATLYRLTNGLPRHELNLMVSEANECEAALRKEIAILEKSVEAKQNNEETNLLLQSILTPLDRYWTVSSLLGRLRDEWTIPSNTTMLDDTTTPSSVPPPTPNCPSAVTLLAATQHTMYNRQHETTTALLATWKKILSHRSSLVFKRPVKPEEAPGYTDRIQFPMDLSLVRKLIVAQKITTYGQLQAYIGLIAHNCVKYNGRESDYGRVAREFEAAADELIRQSVTARPVVPTATATASAAPAVGNKTPAAVKSVPANSTKPAMKPTTTPPPVKAAESAAATKPAAATTTTTTKGE